ncbi:MAG: hypothetical protein AB7F89_24405, partial [Pirellulaceae bacterium]
MTTLRTPRGSDRPALVAAGEQPAAAGEAVHRIAERIQRRWPKQPRAGIILGTGLGSLAEQIERAVEIGYDELPGFPRATAVGHRGRWVCGELAGQPVL